MRLKQSLELHERDCPRDIRIVRSLLQVNVAKNVVIWKELDEVLLI